MAKDTPSPSTSSVPSAIQTIGHRAYDFMTALKTLMDARTTQFIDTFETDQAIRELGFHFRATNWLLGRTSRREGSLLAQFISNHFRNTAYFQRFHIDERRRLCKCGYTHQSARDHFLLQCSRFRIERQALCDRLGVDVSELGWEIIFKAVDSFIPFVIEVLENWIQEEDEAENFAGEQTEHPLLEAPPDAPELL